jgi:hypothetical protein
MTEDEALAWVADFSAALEGRPYYQRSLKKILAFHGFAVPRVKARMKLKSHRGGATAAVEKLFKIRIETWARLVKLAKTPSLQVLAERGQLTTRGINMVKKEEIAISLTTLTKRLNPPPPHDFGGKDEIEFPPGFGTGWTDEDPTWVLPYGIYLDDVREIPPGFEDTYLPAIQELLVMADDGYKVFDPAEVWAIGRSARTFQPRVLLLSDKVPGPGRHQVFGLLYLDWWDKEGKGECKPENMIPSIIGYTTRPAYGGKSFAKVLLRLVPRRWMPRTT